MNWREKIAVLQSELNAFRERAVELVGTCNVDFIDDCANRQPIEVYLSKAKAEDILVHPVPTQGVRCVILSSRLYREFGILIFDASVGGGCPVTVVSLPEHYQHPRFGMTCGCCKPHLEGIGAEAFRTGTDEEREKKREELHASFALAVRQACKEHGVTTLFFGCFANYRLEQDKDGLHLIDWAHESWQQVDRWRFASAFRSLKFSDHAFPFDKLFKR